MSHPRGTKKEHAIASVPSPAAQGVGNEVGAESTPKATHKGQHQHPRGNVQPQQHGRQNQGGGRGRGNRGGRGGRGGRKKGGGGRGHGTGKGGRRAGQGVDHGGGVYSKGGRKGPRLRGGNVGPGTFGCGRLGMVFFAFRFLQRRIFRKNKRHNKEQPGRHGQHGQHGHQANNQPYVGQPRPYESTTHGGGEGKVAEEDSMPVAVAVPVAVAK